MFLLKGTGRYTTPIVIPPLPELEVTLLDKIIVRLQIHGSKKKCSTKFDNYGLKKSISRLFFFEYPVS